MGTLMQILPHVGGGVMGWGGGSWSISNLPFFSHSNGSTCSTYPCVAVKGLNLKERWSLVTGSLTWLYETKVFSNYSWKRVGLVSEIPLVYFLFKTKHCTCCRGVKGCLWHGHRHVLCLQVFLFGQRLPAAEAMPSRRFSSGWLQGPSHSFTGLFPVHHVHRSIPSPSHSFTDLFPVHHVHRSIPSPSCS